MHRLTRREFLAGSAAAALGAIPLLASCTGEPDIDASRTAGPLPLFPGNPMITAGLEPESGPFWLFNYDAYLWKRVLHEFGETQGTRWEYVTFYNSDEAIRRLRRESFDLVVVPSERVPAMVEQRLVQPINLAYLPNLANLWGEAARAGSDPDLRYSIPYTVAKVGIAWWADRLGDGSIRELASPYDAFWDERFRGLASLPDSYRVGMAVGLLHLGIRELNTDDPATIARARDELLRSVARIGLQDPAIWLAWSGDVLATPSNGREPRFWFDGRGILQIDAFVIPRDAPNPVLAHRFLDFVLEPEVASRNSSWLGYRQPVTAPAGRLDRRLREALVTRTDLRHGYPLGALGEEAEVLWRNAWDEVRRALA